MTPEQITMALIMAGLAIYIILWIVYACLGPQYVECKCGAHCKVSNDGWFYWECDECGESGKDNPFL